MRDAMLRNAFALAACRALHVAGKVQQASWPSSTASLPAQTTNAASVCSAACTFNGPWVTAYRWVPVQGTSTATVTVLTIVHKGQTLDIPRTNYAVETVYPYDCDLPLVDAAGYVVESAIVAGSGGLPTPTVLTYPTGLLDYGSSYEVRGPVSASCPTTTKTLPAHPAYTTPESSAVGTDKFGSNHHLQATTYLDTSFLRSAFPSVLDFRDCSAPSTTPKAQMVHQTTPRPVLTTTFITTTYDGFMIYIPHLESSIGEYAPEDGYTYTGDVFSLLTEHTEETVPYAEAGPTSVPEAQPSHGAGPVTTAYANHAGGYAMNSGEIGGYGGDSQNENYGSPQESGSDDGSSVADGDGGSANPDFTSPGTGAGGSAPQESSRPKSHIEVGADDTPTDDGGSDSDGSASSNADEGDSENPTAGGGLVDSDDTSASRAAGSAADAAMASGRTTSVAASGVAATNGGGNGGSSPVASSSGGTDRPSAAAKAMRYPDSNFLIRGIIVIALFIVL